MDNRAIFSAYRRRPRDGSRRPRNLLLSIERTASREREDTRQTALMITSSKDRRMIPSSPTDTYTAKVLATSRTADQTSVCATPSRYGGRGGIPGMKRRASTKSEAIVDTLPDLAWSGRPLEVAPPDLPQDLYEIISTQFWVPGG